MDLFVVGLLICAVCYIIGFAFLRKAGRVDTNNPKVFKIWSTIFFIFGIGTVIIGRFGQYIRLPNITIPALEKGLLVWFNTGQGIIFIVGAIFAITGLIGTINNTREELAKPKKDLQCPRNWGLTIVCAILGTVGTLFVVCSLIELKPIW